MARTRSEEIRLGDESFTVSTLPLGELGRVMPLFRAYFDIWAAANYSPFADGAVEAGAAIVAALLQREVADLLAMPIDFAQLARAILACGSVCGLENNPVGEALAAMAGLMTHSTSDPSTPPSPQDAATDTSISTA